ncbi:transglycosylase SLT domain-containing protein [Vibrio sp. V27_P1S3P104]|uniref:transglycosylase SLT domain-containing protein n=1 Tax=unclassified Vibrio TaxID=2614977 RepID=UPI0013723D55|nr:transglycosylase SLT domain-containing protein [Vibrio sp. V28_P6S34P95]NAX06297.1 transglycosylase SLT domain-containing protein [Vibrio sp. V30_P3S12P165]NAX34896.1 transglycosylase SLT domain-containing protein [Vibrio sp. V29_P1S30P107]NAX37914.1 transglycosylase SLT domain-containing protein [Vibrio sp. V27_P1S3P104]NAX41092.1 transglycosylase SLT domain-containing protein [Vibrio sp. V26_P1S5P106]
MKGTKKPLLVLLLSTLSSVSVANSEAAFAELTQATEQVKQSKQAQYQEFEKYVDARLDEYEAWRDAYTTQLDQQRLALIDRWGSAELSDSSTEVTYSESNAVKRVVDYENNTAVVSVLVDPSMDQAQVSQLIEAQAQLSDGETLDLTQAEVSTANLDYSMTQEQKEKKFIIEQTYAQMNEYDIQADRLIAANIGVADDFIYQRAYRKKMALLDEAKARIMVISQQYQAHRQPLTNSSTEQATDQEVTAPQAPKKIISYKVNLPNNSLATRAKTYQPLALEESGKWALDPALVMAIMHSESAFRPQAKSHVPAFGLMQIVPTTAGHDVNRRIRQIDAPMTEADLYQPEINVETGAAYLHILNSSYLKAITDDQSRLYCTIAAYNTGAGNVARTFNPDRSTNIRQAAVIINQLTPEQVYQRLIQHLPYDETKQYLQKVSTRMALYQPE